MGIPSQRSIRQRLSFMGLKTDDVAALRRLRPTMGKAIPGALDALYGQILASPELAPCFSNGAALSRVKNHQQSHWKNIFNARFDEDYASAARQIGESVATRLRGVLSSVDGPCAARVKTRRSQWPIPLS